MRIITFGTFDLFHIGHFNILKNCKEHGNYLIVGVSTDELSKKKGKETAQNENVRLQNVRNNIYVDLVFFEESLEDKDAYIKKYEADMLIMGDDWANQFDWVSCKVIYLPRTPNISTTLLKQNNNMNELIVSCNFSLDKALKSKKDLNKAANFYSNKHGIINSDLCIYTEYVHTYAIKFFEILNSFHVTYYVFAGSAIGLMRDGKNIPWVDDYDIIVKESELGKISKALVTLKKNNFIIKYYKRFPENGIKIWNKFDTNFGIKNCFVCDIFVSFINKYGFLDNYKKWGRYPQKNVPEKFLGEPKYMKFNDLNLPFFDMFDKDITLEYGDIFNSTIIHLNHRELYRYNLNYSIVYEIFNKKIETLKKDSCNFLDSENNSPITKESILKIKETKSMNEYVSNIQKIYQYVKKNNLKTFEITDDTISYIFDLKYYLEKTKFVYHMNEPNEKILHHLNYIDIVYTNNDSFLNEYFFVRKPIIQKIAAETAPAAEEPK